MGGVVESDGDVGLSSVQRHDLVGDHDREFDVGVLLDERGEDVAESVIDEVEDGDSQGPVKVEVLTQDAPLRPVNVPLYVLGDLHQLKSRWCQVHAVERGVNQARVEPLLQRPQPATDGGASDPQRGRGLSDGRPAMQGEYIAKVIPIHERWLHTGGGASKRSVGRR